MPNNKTLFILGAGASKEVNLPVGSELKLRIREICDIKLSTHGHIAGGDETFINAVHQLVNRPKTTFTNIYDYIDTCEKIRGGMIQAPSIDQYIHVHRDNKLIEECGKLAIVRSILSAESESKLIIKSRNINDTVNFGALSDTWFHKFFQLSFGSSTIGEVKDKLKNITFIIFNYDRCIEYYLYYAFMNYHHISNIEAATIVNSLEIYHPYGTVGSLPWQNKSNPTDFGNEPNTSDLIRIANEIKTFTEGTDKNTSEIESIQKSVTEADKIVFLGFGFLDLNMELMSPKRNKINPLKHISYYGTASGISDSNCLEIKSLLKTFGGGEVVNMNIDNSRKCSALFDEHSRALSINP